MGNIQHKQKQPQLSMYIKNASAAMNSENINFLGFMHNTSMAGKGCFDRLLQAQG